MNCVNEIQSKLKWNENKDWMMAAMNDTSAQPSIHGFIKWIPWIGNGALIG